jgi:hypothetical protein
MLRFSSIADYSATPDLAPVAPIMGEDAYRRYIEHTLPFLKQSGGELLLIRQTARRQRWPERVGRFARATSRNTFRWISPRRRPDSVDGLKTIAERMNRPGHIKSADRPTNHAIRETEIRGRFRDRSKLPVIRSSSACLAEELWPRPQAEP